jgi:hypothetical protein
MTSDMASDITSDITKRRKFGDEAEQRAGRKKAEAGQANTARGITAGNQDGKLHRWHVWCYFAVTHYKPLRARPWAHLAS